MTEALFFQTTRGERHIGGDRDVEHLDALGDPVIGRVGAGRNGDVVETRMCAWPQAAIADDIDGEAVAVRDTRHLSPSPGQASASTKMSSNA